MRPSFPCCRGAAAATIAAAGLALSLTPTDAHAAAIFASSVPDGTYAQGTVNIASGASYADPQAALGAPASIVGDAPFAGVHSPFNSAYANTDLAIIGRGGSITLQYAQPVPVVNGPEIGVYTGVGISDVDFPNGHSAAPATTFAFDEYGADRSALVEVAGANGTFVSLGRFVFNVPTNYFANAISPFQALPPSPAVPADFGKPFTGGLAALSDKTFGQIIQTLDGSAGGTWIDVPGNLGLSSVSYVRFSDPLWVLPGGETAETRTSAFDPRFVKPADLFIDAVSGAAPEPGSATVLAAAAAAALVRRGARHPRFRPRRIGQGIASR